MITYIYTILMVIVIAIFLTFLVKLFDKGICSGEIEKFETYSYGPFNYMDSGADPLTFYKYPIYRNPYNYPYKFYSSYPYPYMTYYPTNI
jgi:hypothetical protein